MFVEQLHQVQKSGAKRTYLSYGKQIDVNVVWLQGQVAEISAEDDYLVLNDGTGAVKVGSITKVPGGCQVSAVGDYVMIIGDVIGFGTNVFIRALKVQQVPESQRDPSLWQLEVIDAQLNT